MKTLGVFVLVLGIGIGVPLLSRMNIHDLQATVVANSTQQSGSGTQQSTLQCFANPPSVYAGDVVVWQTATTGISNLTNIMYTWSGAVTGLGKSFSKTYDTPGAYTSTVKFNDPQFGQKTATCSVNVLVNPNTPAANSGGTQATTQTTTTTDNSTGATQDLTNAPDILNCKMANTTVILSQNQAALMLCRIQPPGSVTARIIKGDYTPPIDPNPASIVKTIAYQKTTYSTLFNLSWDGIDSYDQPVADGDYTFVVSALQTANSKPDISLQKIQVMKNPPPQTEQITGGNTTSSSQQTTTSNASSATTTSSTTNNTAQSSSTPSSSGTASSPTTPPVPPAPAAPVPSKCPGINYPVDIENHWAKDFIKVAYDHCIFHGYSDGTFHPDQTITRFEALKAALIAAGISPKLGCYTVDCGTKFKDLTPQQGQWVRAALDLKIIKGVSSTLFVPQRAITRGEAAILVAKTFGIPPHLGCYTANCGAGYPDNFFLDVSDKVLGSYLRPMWNVKIIQGTRPNMFEPDRLMTRAQMAALLVKTAKVMGKISTVQPLPQESQPASQPSVPESQQSQQILPTQQTTQQ